MARILSAAARTSEKMKNDLRGLWISLDLRAPDLAAPAIHLGFHKKSEREREIVGQGELFNLTLGAGTWHWLKPSPVTKVKVK